MNRLKMWLIRRLLPKCEVCYKNTAYFEHHDLNKGIWYYVCWECSFEYEGQGPIW